MKMQCFKKITLIILVTAIGLLFAGCKEETQYPPPTQQYSPPPQQWQQESQQPSQPEGSTYQENTGQENTGWQTYQGSPTYQPDN